MNAPLQAPDLRPHKLTVDNLLLLTQGGAFARMAKLELLDGILYEMSPQSTAHFKARNRVTFRLQSAIVALALPYEAYSDATVALSESDAPEPDIIVCEHLGDTGFAPVTSVMLAIEVSVSTLKYDLGYKKALYAGAGIPEYWVLDVEAKKIHLFWSPDGQEYRNSIIVEIGDEVASATINGLSIDTSGIF